MFIQRRRGCHVPMMSGAGVTSLDLAKLKVVSFSGLEMISYSPG